MTIKIYDLLPEIVNNLAVMEWDLPQYQHGAEFAQKNMEKIVMEVMQEIHKEK